MLIPGTFQIWQDVLLIMIRMFMVLISRVLPYQLPMSQFFVSFGNTSTTKLKFLKLQLMYYQWLILLSPLNFFHNCYCYWQDCIVWLITDEIAERNSPGSSFGKRNMNRERITANTALIINPNHHAPTQLGSVGVNPLKHGNNHNIRT